MSTAYVAVPSSARTRLLHLWPLFAALLLLALLWFGPLPERARGSFAAHMVMHMGIVAIAAPLLAIGLSRLAPRLFAGIPAGLALAASFAEFVVVWGWHAPALHDAARVETPLFLAEQASFLIAGLFVWVTALGTAEGPNRLGARAAGVAGLLMTSMHMTLLGALLLFSPRPLYACADLCSPAASMTPVEDQALGGVIMLIVGGASYLAGGLFLLSAVLRGPDGRVGPDGPGARASHHDGRLSSVEPARASSVEPARASSVEPARASSVEPARISSVEPEGARR